MKNILIYIAGVLTGIVLTILMAVLLTSSNSVNIPIEEQQGVTLFDEPGDSVDAKRFKVFQVIDTGMALAASEELALNIGDDNLQPLFDTLLHSLFQGPVVLLINDEGKLYYDDQIVEVPQGRSARQVGVYQYSTESGYKTVPIIKIIK